VAVFQPAEVADQYRQAVPLCDDNVAKVFERAHKTDAANDIGLLPTCNAAASGDVTQCEAVAQQLSWIELKLVETVCPSWFGGDSPSM